MKKLMMILLSIVLGATGCSSNEGTNKYTTSQYPPAVSSETDLIKAISGDLSVIKSLVDDLPNQELALERLNSNGMINNKYYYRYKNIPEQSVITNIKLYEGWIVETFKSTDSNVKTSSEDLFNLHWYTKNENAQNYYNEFVNEQMIESDRSDRKGYYYHKSEYKAVDGILVSTYTVIWMQDGYCFGASFPARYGLEAILDLYDVERVNVA